MRKLLSGTLALLLASCASVPELPPAAGLAKVEFVAEVTTPGVQKLLQWSDDRFYYASKDGSVQVADAEGKVLMSLQAKNEKGEALLKRPEALAIDNDTLYVVDSLSSRVAMFSPDGEYRGSFASKGSGAGQLSSPRGIASYDGVVYVSDSGNDRIQLFGRNGVFLATLEIRAANDNPQVKEAKYPYELKQPADIALDTEGRIYVLDSDDSLIKVYNQHGAYLKHLNLNGKPVGFRVAADGIYVADIASYTIQKFDFDGTLAYYFGSKGEGRSQFQGIAGLALGSKRKVIVGDEVKGVADVFLAEASAPKTPGEQDIARTSVRLDSVTSVPALHLAWNGSDTLYAVAGDRKAIARLQDGATGEKLIPKGVVPGAIAVGPDGNLWVVDKKNQRIVRLNGQGEVVTAFGKKGSGAGLFDEPSDIAISSTGIIFVADPGNNWVQAFSRDGLFLSVIRGGSGGNFGKPVAVTLDPHDNLYVLDKGRSAVVMFSAKGEPLGEFGNDRERQVYLSGPVDLMATSDEVHVLEDTGVKVFSSKGEYLRSYGARGHGVGEVSKPGAITAIDRSAFAIADSGNGRVMRFTTIYKPAAPAEIVAKGGVHGATISWAKADLPYVKQYVVYRATSEDGVYTRAGVTTGNTFRDRLLAPKTTFFYRVAAENHFGDEGYRSAAVEAITTIYSPPAFEEVKVEASAWFLKLSWDPLEKDYIKNYLIYQKRDGEFFRIAQTTEPEYIRKSLTPNTDYTFYVSTLSVDGIESPKLQVNAATLAHNRAPLELETMSLGDIFSNSYKLYERDGLGQLRLTNNTATPMENIKVTFTIKNFMDFPTETTVALLAPGESLEIPLKAVFNNNILTVTEDTPVQTELVATYFENGEEKTYTKNQAINVYEKHRLMWSEHGRFAAFVTPKDPVVLDYARGVATQFPDTRDPMQWAAAIYAALGLSGVTYIQDPSNPYQVTSGATDYVDFIQYPRETLERKSGDCDDLVALYSSALESMGITTRVVEVPGHMLMMLSTGISAENDGYTMDNMYVIHDEVLWIPVEVTLIGKSFTKAWEVGSETFYRWKGKELNILNVHEAWGTYKPASLPATTWKAKSVSRKAIEKRFPDQHETLLRIVSRTRMRRYLQALEKNPDDAQALTQAAIISAKAGDLDAAAKFLQQVLNANPNNAVALNNRGNLRFMQSKYQDAVNDYQGAAKSDPSDAHIWVNLAKTYKALKNRKKARAAFKQAQKIDPSIRMQYRTMAIELLGR
jgi:DNA-binding beta-propeller fold protein YncE/transglutaminase-like putative cysteine protease